MAKPTTRQGYDDAFTLECERLLVTLLRGLGPWKESVFLVGGLTPRYLVPDRPPVVPPHAGTQDVDVVIDLQILADTDAYATLEHNLKRLALSAWSFLNRCLGLPRPWRRPGTASSSFSKGTESCWFAGPTRTAIGMPFPSVIRWCLVPFFPRSVGFGPISWPPFLP